MSTMHIITDARVVLPNKIVSNNAVVLKNDRIERIVPMDQVSQIPDLDESAVWHNAQNAYVTAGFIDIHSDAIETVIQPRPPSIIDIQIALMEHEKQLVNQGITTMYHSLSFLRDQDGSITDKEARKPEKLREMAQLINLIRSKLRLIRHRFHCRFDIRNEEGYAAMIEYLNKGYIHLLSFIDHTPGQGQYRNLEKYRKNIKQYRPHLEETHHTESELAR